MLAVDHPVVPIAVVDDREPQLVEIEFGRNAIAVCFGEIPLGDQRRRRPNQVDQDWADFRRDAIEAASP